ncbi:MAG: transposase [Bacteroidia bacterium]
MMNEKWLFDLYVDYLMVSSDQVTATGLSEAVDGSVSHDKITRLLSQSPELFESQSYWKRIKPVVRKVESDEGILILDDFIVEKPHSSENELICWHHSHLKGGVVKGINIVHLQYNVHHDSQAVNLPVGFEFVRKTEIQKDEKTGKETRVSPTNKNEIARELLRQAHFMHHIPFRWVLADSWYSNAANMKFIHSKLKKHFLFGLKSNRKVALSKGQLRRKDFVKLVDLKLQPGQVQQIWLDRVPFPLYVAKEVYVNADQSKGELYLVTNKEGMTYQQMISLYPERWRIEPSHKSLKNNASIAASPTKTPETQANHIVASFCALVQFEWIKIHSSIKNHFAIKRKFYSAAIKIAFKELQQLKYSIARA